MGVTNYNIHAYMKVAMEKGATDLHIKAGRPVRARISGQLVNFGNDTVTPEITQSMAKELMTPERKE